MNDIINNFKSAWNNPIQRTLLVIAMILPIAFIVLFKVKIFGLNNPVARRTRARVTAYRSSRASRSRTYRRRR